MAGKWAEEWCALDFGRVQSGAVSPLPDELVGDGVPAGDEQALRVLASKHGFHLFAIIPIRVTDLCGVDCEFCCFGFGCAPDHQGMRKRPALRSRD